MPLTDMQGVVTPQYFLNRRLPDPNRHRASFRGFTRHISAGRNYGRLLDGEADFLINFSTHAWDHMPGIALATAAGFHAARHDARPFDPLDSKGGVLVAPDAASWREILALLVDTGGVVRSFVMSCRVFNRRVEFAFLHWLARSGRRLNAFDVAATERNLPARTFLGAAAFRPAGADRLEFDAARFVEENADAETLFRLVQP